MLLLGASLQIMAQELGDSLRAVEAIDQRTSITGMLADSEKRSGIEYVVIVARNSLQMHLWPTFVMNAVPVVLAMFMVRARMSPLPRRVQNRAVTDGKVRP